AVLLRFTPAPLERRALVLAMALAIVAVVSTAVIQRPIHVQLESVANSPQLLARLQATNWLRLVPEWIRAGLYLWMASLLVTVMPARAELLFAYGTLQLEAVQMATFGRRLTGRGDAL